MASNIFSSVSPLFRRSQEDDANELGLNPDMANSDGGFRLSTTDTMNLLVAKQRGQAKTTFVHPTYPTPQTPRVGGVDKLGAWTRHGALDEGQEPRSPNCMRAFKADALKEHQALKPVEEACNKGITEEKMQFCLKNETNTNHLCLCIRNIEKCFQDLGMELVCDIFLKDGDTINKLQEPGLLTKEIVDTWINDLTVIGVWDPVNKTGLPVCPCDQKNMMMSSKGMMNSCSEGLQLLLKEGLKLKDMN
jgi:hypothetical protein